MNLNVFVTVGTTKFPKLIDTITTEEVLSTLISLGYNFVQIQTGKDFSKVHIQPDISYPYTIENDGNSIVVEFSNKLVLKYTPYFDNFEAEVLKSDLVISHAGAGTCLEVLQKKKPLLVVINEDLMDNHQIELAEELQNNGYLYYCTCETLSEVLKEDFLKLKEYPKPKQLLFSEYLNKCVGFC